MAGMLPGVECARRRRFHQSGDSPSVAASVRTRRASFCLYTSNHESHHTPISSLRSITNHAYRDEKLGGLAREAKERLDERLGTQRKLPESKRHGGDDKERLSRSSSRVDGIRRSHTEVFGSKKSGSKRFSWSKLISWRASEQEECAICLEKFKVGDTLVHLPCAHRFHARCLVPWLEGAAQCPCCRMEILISSFPPVDIK